MNVTILTVGTEGDVRPFIALALGLSREGHTVRLAANKNFAGLVIKSGLAFASLSGDFHALAAEAHSVMQAGLGVFTVPRIMRRALVPMARHWAEEGSDACADADLIIGSGTADFLAASIAEAFAKPCALAYLQPLVPSYDIPPVAFPPRSDAYIPFVNISFHYISRLFLWHIVRPACNDVVRRSLGLHPYPWYGPQYWGAYSRAQIIHGYSPYVVPPALGWPDRVKVAGYWFFDEPDWQLPADLVDFLAAGPPPIYVGFGSALSPLAFPDFGQSISTTQSFDKTTCKLPTRDTKATTRLVLNAVRTRGCRAVLATGWKGMRKMPGWPDDQVFVTGRVSHNWLFQKVTLAVHHGSAGTTAATLRAGIPSVVVPFFADQPFWAWRLEKLGIAPPRMSINTLTAEQLAHAIGLANETGMRKRASEAAKQILSEDGVGVAVAMLADFASLNTQGGGRRSPVRLA